MTKVRCAVEWCIHNDKGTCTEEVVHLSEDPRFAYPNELDCQEFEQ